MPDENIKIPNLLDEDGNSIPLSEIAWIIANDWELSDPRGISKYAEPYLNAMGFLDDLDDDYNGDSASAIVSYFLGAAQQWQGPVARAVKKHLKKILKENRKQNNS